VSTDPILTMRRLGENLNRDDGTRECLQMFTALASFRRPRIFSSHHGISHKPKSAPVGPKTVAAVLYV